MNVRTILERTQRGEPLPAADLRAFIAAHVAGRIPDYQMSAWLMAVWFRGLDRDATLELVRAMMESGRVLNLDEIPGPKVDKHSTGGIGDKISLPLAGIAAACGLCVPMLSGRGLGHTGGTLDKLESIPGYSTRFEEAAFRRTLREVGASIVGQSDDLVPADRSLYALRDVTATVDCVPLIVASILSKKFAAGVGAVVMDVKVGSGAFMRDRAAAETLARELIEVGRAFERRVSVVFTRMDEPLGVAVGNAVEVIEAVDVLRGGGPKEVRHLSCVLAGEILRLAERVTDEKAGEAVAAAALASGAALQRFDAMVRAHGGRLDLDRPDCGLQVAPVAAVITATRAAWLAGVHGTEVGFAVVDLGGGRLCKEDDVDPSVGLRWRARIGAHLEVGATIVEILAPNHRDVEAVAARLRAALTWSDVEVQAPEWILGRMGD